MQGNHSYDKKCKFVIGNFTNEKREKVNKRMKWGITISEIIKWKLSLEYMAIKN